MPLFYHPNLLQSPNVLPEEESRHAVRTLRLKSSDAIAITDGKGSRIDAMIVEANPEGCTYTITRKVKIETPSYSIHLAIAPTKQRDRMEWMVEKIVELGVHRISFFQCRNSERLKINANRLEKIAISAMKQSQRSWLPEIETNLNFDQLLQRDEEQKFIAFVDSSNPYHLKDEAKPDTSYLMLIGPEGDFTQNELAKALDSGFKKVSLGPYRLRTETAGLAACSIFNLINQ